MTAHAPTSQVIRVTVAGGYRPATIVARARVPLRIVFRRLDTDECTERVVFSSPHIERRLVPNAETAIDLPAQPAGDIRFTCGMGRYRGHIRLVEAAPRGWLDRIRAPASRLDQPLGLAVVLWLCTLPFLVLALALFLAPSLVLFAAAAGLAVWVAGCLWAFRSSAPAVSDHHDHGKKS